MKMGLTETEWKGLTGLKINKFSGFIKYKELLSHSTTDFSRNPVHEFTYLKMFQLLIFLLGIILKQLRIFTLVSVYVLIIQFKNYVAGSQRRKCDLIFGMKTFSKDKNYMKN